MLSNDMIRHYATADDEMEEQREEPQREGLRINSAIERVLQYGRREVFQPTNAEITTGWSDYPTQRWRWHWDANQHAMYAQMMLAQQARITRSERRWRNRFPKIYGNRGPERFPTLMPMALYGANVRGTGVKKDLRLDTVNVRVPTTLNIHTGTQIPRGEQQLWITDGRPNPNPPYRPNIYPHTADMWKGLRYRPLPGQPEHPEVVKLGKIVRDFFPNPNPTPWNFRGLATNIHQRRTPFEQMSDLVDYGNLLDQQVERRKLPDFDKRKAQRFELHHRGLQRKAKFATEMPRAIQRIDPTGANRYAAMINNAEGDWFPHINHPSYFSKKDRRKLFTRRGKRRG